MKATVGARPGQLAFRSAMARFPAGVTIVTTRDTDGTACGFTATSFCSVSLEPPLILVCLARTANSFAVFMRCRRFAVSILQEHHSGVAERFASKRTDKFDAHAFAATPDGLPAVDAALCVIGCELTDRHEAGDHVILVGRVYDVSLRDGKPMVYFDQRYHRLHESR